MIPGAFTYDDDGNDIVTLSPVDPDQTTVCGWVNIGEHAVELTLDSNGGLCIKSHAKGHEGQTLASLHVPRLAATLVRLRGGRRDLMDPLQAFVNDLTDMGFNSDEPISGADTVDMVARHYPALRSIAEPSGTDATPDIEGMAVDLDRAVYADATQNRIPVFVVELDGGTIQRTSGTEPARVIFIDADTESDDEDRIKQVFETDHYVTEHRVDGGPDETNRVRQVVEDLSKPQEGPL